MKQKCPEKKALKIHDDFVALFGSDLQASAMSLIQKIVKDRDIDLLINFFKRFGDILDSNDYGIKVELENNDKYKSYSFDLAKKRLAIRKNKKESAIFQKNIDRVNNLVYGMNSTILLKGVLNSSSKTKEILPAQVKVFLEGIETLVEQNLNMMLNDLENEWKVTLKKPPVSEININKLLEEAENKAEILKSKEQIQIPKNLRDNIANSIMDGAVILQKFKSIRTFDDSWPIEEFKTWCDRVFGIFDENQLLSERALFFKDVHLGDEPIVLKDYIQACEAGLDRLEQIIEKL
ncbi:MAG: hypothetical protein A2Z15_06340 [Chloroflexi bacterium RBG_16_50_11]|nr:MAG: hypothetical protein A2Z15_06340 [Chloroflexi bacterium RBG_16_50_11]